MGNYETWEDLRAELIEAFNGTLPTPDAETAIIAAYELHPGTLEKIALDILNQYVTTGDIRSPWGLLHYKAGKITTAPSNPTRNSSIDREKRITRAEQWIRNAGMHYKSEYEIEDELFNERGLLREHLDLRQRMLHYWAEHRPTGMQIERDAIARAEAWKAAQHLIRARADDDQPL